MLTVPLSVLAFIISLFAHTVTPVNATKIKATIKDNTIFFSL